MSRSFAMCSGPPSKAIVRERAVACCDVLTSQKTRSQPKNARENKQTKHTSKPAVWVSPLRTSSRGSRRGRRCKRARTQGQGHGEIEALARLRKSPWPIIIIIIRRRVIMIIRMRIMLAHGNCENHVHYFHYFSYLYHYPPNQHRSIVWGVNYSTIIYYVPHIWHS